MADVVIEKTKVLVVNHPPVRVLMPAEIEALNQKWREMYILSPRLMSLP